MPRFVLFKDVRGQYRWHLKAGNNEIIAVSEAYINKQGAERSLSLVKEFASKTPVVDNTRVLLVRS